MSITADAKVMRMASRTISEASMKTCEAASATPSPTTAMPPQVMPLDQLEPDEFGAPLVDVHLAARQRQELAAGGDHEELGRDDGGEPRGGLDHRRPEHRRQREDDGQQRQGDARGQLVAHEHGQQLVLELRLQDGVVRELGADLAQDGPAWPLADPSRAAAAGRPQCRRRLAYSPSSCRAGTCSPRDFCTPAASTDRHIEPCRGNLGPNY